MLIKTNFGGSLNTKDERVKLGELIKKLALEDKPRPVKLNKDLIKEAMEKINKLKLLEKR